MKKEWLAPFTWPVIVETNRQLCLPKGALHQRTSDGYEPSRRLWEGSHPSAMTLSEATDLCRRCHQLAPFCNFNGNTFVAVIRKVVSAIPLSADQAAVLRSLTGHIVAGIATPEEQQAFHDVLTRLAHSEAV